MLRETNSRSPISRNVRWVCRYGSSRSSAGLSGDAPVAPADDSDVRSCAKARDLVVEDAERGPVEHDVVDLAEQVTSGRSGRPMATYTLARWSRTRTASHGMTHVHVGRARIALVSCRSASFAIASVQRKPGRGGERQNRRRVVVHPILVDRGQCQVEMCGGFSPLATIHREQRELGFGVDDGVGVAQ